MILADSSVWIDVFNEHRTIQTQIFERLLIDNQVMGMADLVIVEVLQGARSDREFDRMAARLGWFETVRIVDDTLAVQAARNYRTLRPRHHGARDDRHARRNPLHSRWFALAL